MQRWSSRAFYPHDEFHVDAAVGSRVLQLEPLVKGQIIGTQQAGQRDCEGAQCSLTVVIFDL